jgi:hypothetical protein
MGMAAQPSRRVVYNYIPAMITSSREEQLND